jgi:Porin PorA
MRGAIGVVLAGLGACLILVAILLPTWVTGQVVKFPLNEYETATLTASNASYFSPGSLSEKTGVTMEATYTIKGDASKGNSSTAVWNEYSYVYDLTNHQAVQEMTRTFAFDRRTGQLVNCCGASLNGVATVQTGLVGYVFPIGTQKQTYQVYDTTLKRPMPFTYSGTTAVDGVQAYEFVENVTPVQIATQSVPGSFVGSSAAVVSAPEFDQLHLIYYVDPDTGALLDVNEDQTLTLHNPDTGAVALVLFDADLIATPASVHQIVGLDSSGRNELALLETTLPLALGIAGGVALLAGIFLGRKPRDAQAVSVAPDTTESVVPDTTESVAPETAESMAPATAESVAPETAQGADARPAPADQSGELAVVPGLDDGTQESAAEAPEGEGTQNPGPGAPGR